MDNGDGDVPITSLDQAVGEADACDEATLRVTFPDGVRRASVLLVLGNSPGELCSDWTAKDDAALKEIGKVIGAVSDTWEGTEQRLTTWAERRARGY